MSGFDRFLEVAAHDFMRTQPELEASAHLTREVLSEYRSRRVSAAERERIQDHLVACRDCADSLLALIAQAPAPPWWKRLGPSFAGVSRQPAFVALASAVIALGLWQAYSLSTRSLVLDQGMQVEMSEVQTPTLAKLAGVRGHVLRSGAIADSSLGKDELFDGTSRDQPGAAKEILNIRSDCQQEVEPQIQAPIVELFAGPSRGQSEAAKQIPFAPDMWIFTLVLHVPEPGPGAKFDLHLVNAEGTVLWRAKSISPDVDGSITLTIPRQTIGKVRELRIRLLESGKRSIVAAYAFRLVAP